jgi:cell shape-determining protein MreC
MLFTWGMVVGLVFLFAVPQKASDRMQLTYARVFRWPLAAGHGLTLAARPVATPQGVTAEEYKNQQQIQTLVANLQAKLRETERKNQVLTNLRGAIGSETTPTLLALIISRNDQGELFIIGGKDQGLAVGQFVMSPGDQDVVDPSASIIGTISSVDAKTAKVRLVTAPVDPKAPIDPKTSVDTRVAVSIGNLGIRVFLEGRGQNKAKVLLVKADYLSKIAKGDPVYVQKSQGLEAPVLVGRIAQCLRSRDDPMFLDITVEPVCDVASLREVAVVVAPVPVK